MIVPTTEMIVPTTEAMTDRGEDLLVRVAKALADGEAAMTAGLAVESLARVSAHDMNFSIYLS